MIAKTNRTSKTNEVAKQVFNQINFPINKIENQDEYDVTLEIHNSEGVVTSFLKTKIRFIWSYLELYQDLLNKAEQDKSNYENQHKKCNNILNALTSK